MIYKCKVYLNKQTEAGASELYFTFSETEFKNLKKKAKKVNYDGSLKMRNGDIVTIIK